MTTTPTLARTCFRALGVEVELQLDAPGQERAAFAETRALIERLEGVLSRFDATSALSRLNRDGAIEGEPELAEVVALARSARLESSGRVDPTVYDAVRAWGYDASFELLGEPRAAPTTPVPCGGAFEVDRAAGAVRLDAGVRLDLGGIAKGYVVDRAADLLGGWGPCLVNAGGDLTVRGLLDGGGWPVGVETADGSLTLSLPWGALATSGSDVRRWRVGDGEAHHLIDPATGRPSASDLLRVTAAGATTVAAEVTAKSLFLAGAQAAVREAERDGIPAVLVTREGATLTTGGLA